MRRLHGLAPMVLWSASAAAADSLVWTRTADALAVGLPVLAYATAGSFKSDPEGLRELTLGLAATVATSEVLKRAIPVARPDGSDDKSFPSRHTAVAFAAAQFLDRRYGNEVALYRPWMYAAAAMTGVSSVQARRHRWGDVIAGGALGYGLARWSTSSQSPSSAERLSQWQVMPSPSPAVAGTGWRVSWQARW